MTNNPKLVSVRWHQWDMSDSDYSQEAGDYNEPRDDFRYRCDYGNEVFYSILEPQDVREILEQIRAGARLEVHRLHHFTDEDADCVAEILELDAVEDYGDEFLLIAACHRTYLRSPLIAELLIIHRLSQGDTVDEIVHESTVGECFYGDRENMEAHFLPFVTMCDRKRLNDKLELELKHLGLAKRVVKL